MVHRLLAGLPEVQSVVGVDLRPMAHPPTDPRFRFERADLRRPDPGLLDGIDTVLHFAFHLKPSRDPGVDRALNVEAAVALLEHAGAAGAAQFVYPSSTTVYGARPGEAAPHPETDPLRPTPGFRYGEHKAEVERYLATYAATHPALKVTVLRPCIVLGPGAVNFVAELLAMKRLPVVAGADPEMQFLAADDLGSAGLAVVEQRAAGIFNLAGSGTIRWREAIRLCGSHPVPLPSRLLRSLADASWALRLQHRSPSGGMELIRHPWLADTRRARQVLGWEPRHPSRRVLELWADEERRCGAPAAPTRESPLAGEATRPRETL